MEATAYELSEKLTILWKRRKKVDSVEIGGVNENFFIQRIPGLHQNPTKNKKRHITYLRLRTEKHG